MPQRCAIRQILLRVALSALLALAGCAHVPDINAEIDTANARPALVGPRGPLSPAQSKAVLDKLEREAGDTDVLQRHLAIEGALTDTPISVGNDVKMLPNGAAAFDAIFTAIESAAKHINIEFFTIEDVPHEGTTLSAVLKRKLQQGVQVNIIFDSFGSARTPDDFFLGLREAGANIVDFNPVNPLLAKGTYKPNDRDHRKIVIVDGRIAIIGGVNLSSVYLSLPVRRSQNKRPPTEWKDTDVRLEGPVVHELQKLFLATWKTQRGPALDESTFFPEVPARGSEIVHIVGSEPGKYVPPYYASLLSAIRNAETRVWATAAYFVPTKQELQDLIDAAHRGVDVKLLLAGKTDSDLAKNAGQSHYAALLKNGVEIYETQNSVLHSKTAVVDDVWSVVGSSNFDHRSVLFNSEVDAVILGRETAKQLETIFQDEIAKARKIDPQTWSHRPLGPRLKEFFANLWGNLL
jgi:cardiolipin synthase